mmetsp:Transcript_6945/g.15199  ORF Transcript_6945/g.15199 Transcript_6945/m.15199 type:complete len:495 (-) Transcript_6945:495-1979(-)
MDFGDTFFDAVPSGMAVPACRKKDAALELEFSNLVAQAPLSIASQLRKSLEVAEEKTKGELAFVREKLEVARASTASAAERADIARCEAKHADAHSSEASASDVKAAREVEEAEAALESARARRQAAALELMRAQETAELAAARSIEAVTRRLALEQAQQATHGKVGELERAAALARAEALTQLVSAERQRRESEGRQMALMFEQQQPDLSPLPPPPPRAASGGSGTGMREGAPGSVGCSSPSEADQLAELLSRLSLRHLLPAFKENDVGILEIELLTDSDFEEMGLAPSLRRRLLDGIQQAPHSRPAACTAPASTSAFALVVGSSAERGPPATEGGLPLQRQRPKGTSGSEPLSVCAQLSIPHGGSECRPEELIGLTEVERRQLLELRSRAAHEGSAEELTAALASAAMQSSKSLAQRRPSNAAAEAELAGTPPYTATSASTLAAHPRDILAQPAAGAVGDASAARGKSSHRSGGVWGKSPKELASPLMGPPT